MKNYKTTLVGCIGAAMTVVVAMIQNGNVSAKDIAIAAVLAAVSACAKDFDTVGAGQTASKG